ncbi:hypothetical protein DPSP01_005260 [Paraphaeosphaeria sporulosa]|uniref:C2H2-type domain-containing protein n=1 Tax=Paraphaeosphaeria sporulosa TaxID=1460663 RepID=A0A177C637_9PLEO|nr:uncharacterized protein CC84DRAFT_1189587 [Paraphaeosphaeria sporulosa]OAG02342.1 hypothetical protein CC84DRAFT_1189587 [Paraphaeosphaeria sporulosa]
MTKKRKRYPDLNQKLERPWCFYCERDFDDLKILISHQKAKHFKCEKCGRRLNTAGGLNVHMTQVHKEQLNQVENAIAGRGGLDIEIFGMEGVPPEIIDQHNQQVTAAHFADEAARQLATGNPTRGSGLNGATKRAKKNETLEEIQERAEKYRVDRANGVLPLPVADVQLEPTPPAAQPFAPPPGAAGYAPGQFPPGAVAPVRPGSIPGAGGLPQRPPFGAPPPGAFPPNGAPPGTDFTASLDDLIADAQKPPTAEASAEKKSKKDKNIRLVFFDEIVSPEEKMAALPRYAEFARV